MSLFVLKVSTHKGIKISSRVSRCNRINNFCTKMKTGSEMENRITLPIITQLKCVVLLPIKSYWKLFRKFTGSLKLLLVLPQLFRSRRYFLVGIDNKYVTVQYFTLNHSCIMQFLTVFSGNVVTACPPLHWWRRGGRKEEGDVKYFITVGEITSTK